MNRLNYTDLSNQEAEDIYNELKKQCNSVKWIEFSLSLAWNDYKRGRFDYDGATFVQEYNGNFWEVASFIHDWLNVIGYVGKQVDLYFIKIMIKLQYPENIIFERCKWMQYTFLNKLIHRIKRNFKGDKLPEILINK